jgi:hypothetical protein
VPRLGISGAKPLLIPIGLNGVDREKLHTFKYNKVTSNTNQKCTQVTLKFVRKMKGQSAAALLVPAVL